MVAQQRGHHRLGGTAVRPKSLTSPHTFQGELLHPVLPLLHARLATGSRRPLAQCAFFGSVRPECQPWQVSAGVGAGSGLVSALKPGPWTDTATSVTGRPG